MAARRKHRLVLDITFSEPVTERDARVGALILLDRLDLNKEPVWAYRSSPYCDKLTVKARSRAIGRRAT